MQTLRNAENTRSFNNDKGIIYLPRRQLLLQQSVFSYSSSSFLLSLILLIIL